MANKSKGRPTMYKESMQGRTPAVLTNYREMFKINNKINARLNSKEREWSCRYCNSNSLLDIEYGCAKCQPSLFGKPKAQPIGRVYKDEQ